MSDRASFVSPPTDGREPSPAPRGSIRTGSVPPAAFAERLRDLLSTLEVATLLGAAGERVRGLGEHLRFA